VTSKNAAPADAGACAASRPSAAMSDEGSTTISLGIVLDDTVRDRPSW